MCVWRLKLPEDGEVFNLKLKAFVGVFGARERVARMSANPLS